MIFDRLTLHNFQRYGGTNTIEFPDPEETLLVVVLARGVAQDYDLNPHG